MAKLLPATWRGSVDELRNRFMYTFDRWLPETWRREADTIDLREWPPRFITTGRPVIDLEETDDDVVVKAELPGLKKSDFNVEVDGRRLVLRGEKTASRAEKGRACHYTECAYGSFYRSVPLPCEIDADATKAKFKNGVLTVTLPKTPEAKARDCRVKIN